MAKADYLEALGCLLAFLANPTGGARISCPSQEALVNRAFEEENKHECARTSPELGDGGGPREGRDHPGGRRVRKVQRRGFDGFARVAAGLGVPVPQFFGIFIPLVEGIGGALLLVGLGARWVAVLFVIEFLVTSFALKTPRQPPFGGWDSMRIDLMLLAAAVAIVLVGRGVFALESMWRRARGGGQLVGRTASA